jgi:hypothetical protein
MKLNIREFDISRIRTDNIVVLLGKRNTGKSFLIRDILSYNTDLPIGTVISPTERANRFYGNMIPCTLIHDEFDSNITSNVRKRQEMIMAQKKKEEAIYGQSSIDSRAFLIMDDCLYDNVWAKDVNMKYFFMNGRHINLFLLITMQYPLGIPPILRGQVDYVFILRDNVMGNRRRIYENYASMFPSIDIFNQVMDQCTEDYHCLVIDNTSASNNLEDIVFWYKAKPHNEEFTLCSREIWAESKQKERMMLDNDIDGDDVYNPEHPSLRRTKNPIKINVNKSSRF